MSVDAAVANASSSWLDKERTIAGSGFNRWLVPPGAYWGHGIYNGYYWVPGFTSEASPSLDELAAGLVSLTDY